MSRLLVDGRTDAGVHVRVLEVDEGGYLDRFTVLIDGETVPYTHAARMRDGGTTTIDTGRGQIYAYRGLGRPHWTTLDGEPIHEEDAHGTQADAEREAK